MESRTESTGLSDDILAAIGEGVVACDGDGCIVYVNGQVERMSGYPARQLVGRSIEVLLPAAAAALHETHRSRYAEAPARRAMAPGLDVRLRRRDGTEQAVDVVLNPLATSDGPLTVAVLRGVSRRRTSEHLDAMVEVTQSILAGGRALQVLELIARRARELAAARLAVIATPDTGSDALVVSVADGDGATRLRGMRFPAGRTILGHTLASPEPVVVADLTADPRADPDFVRAADVGPALIVPLAIPDDHFGMLIVANRRGGTRFDGEDVAVVRLFASAAAVAVGYPRDRDATRRMILLQERERIARELQDSVIQSLFSVGIGLQHSALLSREPEVSRRLQASISGLDQAVTDLREAVFPMLPKADEEPDRPT